MTRNRQPRIRTGIVRLLMRIPPLRRRWVSRTLAYIEEGGTKKRPLPPELQAVRAMLLRLPKHQRAAALETALRSGAPPPEAQSRELRRAAARQAKRGRRR